VATSFADLPVSNVPASDPTPSTPRSGQQQDSAPVGGDQSAAALPQVEVGAGANTGDHAAGVLLQVTPTPGVGVTIDETALGTSPAHPPGEPGVVIQAGPLGTVALP
jgi:hypothetical protein